nr:hypothetical protein [Gemmatimonadaceae bacterium]
MLRARKNALSDQLVSADGRRQELHKQLRDATGPDRAGLEQRLGILDGRIARLETEIDQNSQALASLPVIGSTSSSTGSGLRLSPGSGMSERAMIPVLIVFTLFVLCPMALAMARNIWKRGTPAKPAPLSSETAQRLERIEQAMDTIAVEIERVSEGQRFVTKLLSRDPAALGVGAAQPVSVR